MQQLVLCYRVYADFDIPQDRTICFYHENKELAKAELDEKINKLKSKPRESRRDTKLIFAKKELENDLFYSPEGEGEESKFEIFTLEEWFQKEAKKKTVYG